jgi:hypothetical protein
MLMGIPTLNILQVKKIYVHSRQLQKSICTSFRNKKKREPRDLYLPVSWRVQIHFIFTDNDVYCVYPAMPKSPKQLSNCLKRAENNRLSNRFQWCHLPFPRVYCYHFLPSLYMNQIPEKLYFGQWPYTTNNYAIWLVKYSKYRINIISIPVNKRW